ncbi:hypothetical protein EG830_11340, partial [bacterium]|nr:hypothetical protein [bacterium]
MKRLLVKLTVMLYMLPAVAGTVAAQTDTDTVESAVPAAVAAGPQAENDGTALVYRCDIRKMIAAPLWRSVKKSFTEADSLNADYMLIHMNTYGGQVDIADSMRTLI